VVQEEKVPRDTIGLRIARPVRQRLTEHVASSGKRVYRVVEDALTMYFDAQQEER
jgi:hypothetical protein